MAKRFIDTKIWDKAWFRRLTTKNKLFLIYLLTKCDHAGIWDADWEAVEFYIGEWVEFKELPKEITNKMQYIKGEEQYFIPAFLEFQYGVLRDVSKPHKSVIKRLKDKGLLKSLDNSLLSIKDKEEDRDKDKKKDKEAREADFKVSVYTFAKEVKDISEKQLENFISYWSESNINGKKMKYEMQKTFDVKRRLIKWRDNNKEWSKNKMPTKKSLESQFVKLKSGIGYKAWCSKCGKKEMPADFFALKRGSGCCAVEYLNKEPKESNDEIDFNSFVRENKNAKGLSSLSKIING